MVKADTLRKCLLFIAMILSGGVMLLPRLPMLGAFMLLYVLIPGSNRRLENRLLLPVLLLGLILLQTLFRHSGVDIQSLAIRYANFAAGLLLLNLYLQQPANTLANDLYPVLKWMGIQAVLTFILGTVASFLFLHISYQEEDIRTFFFLLFYHSFLEGMPVRPDGFFYEPGVFQLYLNLYLYLAVFIHRSWRQALLALVSIGLAASTTGMLICVITLGVFFVGHLRRSNLRAKLVSLALAIFIAAPLAYVVVQNVQEKTTGTYRGSSWAREYDFYTGLNVVRENWLNGIGFDYDQYLEAAHRLGYAETELDERTIVDRGNTNGIMFLLYSIGVPLALPFLFGMFRQRLFPNRFVIGAILFLSLFGESIIFTPFPLCLMFSGMAAALGLRSGRTLGSDKSLLQPVGRAVPT